MTSDWAAPFEVAFRASAQLGEGPTWDPATATLIWVDILGCEVHRLSVASGRDVTMRTAQHVGAAKPRAGGGLVVNLRDGIGQYDPDGAFRWLVHDPVDGRRGNDAAVDAAGNLWAGTMRYAAATNQGAEGGGTLIRLSPSGQCVTVLDDVTISNGTGWSPDGRLMYYVDTPTRRIDVFTVAGSGSVVGRRPFVVLAPDLPGSPDGLTVDADGCVWVALWGGAALHRYTPEGDLDRVLRLPVDYPTACAFGGQHLRDLYVTTATAALGDGQLAGQPLAGSVLVIPDAGVGLPGHAFADGPPAGGS